MMSFVRPRSERSERQRNPARAGAELGAATALAAVVDQQHGRSDRQARADRERDICRNGGAAGDPKVVGGRGRAPEGVPTTNTRVVGATASPQRQAAQHAACDEDGTRRGRETDRCGREQPRCVRGGRCRRQHGIRAGGTLRLDDGVVGLVGVEVGVGCGLSGTRLRCDSNLQATDPLVDRALAFCGKACAVSLHRVQGQCQISQPILGEGDVEQKGVVSRQGVSGLERLNRGCVLASVEQNLPVLVQLQDLGSFVVRQLWPRGASRRLRCWAGRTPSEHAHKGQRR